MNNYCSDQIIENGLRIKCSKEAKFSILEQKISDSSKLQSPITASISVGGVHEGDVFEVGTTVQSIIKKIVAPSQPEVEGKMYFVALDYDPQSFSEEDFGDKLDIPSSALQEGITLQFPDDIMGAKYCVFAYPKQLGLLVHIYQNDLTMFDLLDDFDKREFADKENYYIYVANEKAIEAGSKYQFLFN